MVDHLSEKDLGRTKTRASLVNTTECCIFTQSSSKWLSTISFPVPESTWRRLHDEVSQDCAETRVKSQVASVKSWVK